MFTSLSIHNFRCFKALSIENCLDRVNLIAGLNSVGKSALLEAIYVLIGMGNIELIPRLSTWRGVAGEFAGELPHLSELFWEPFFYNLNSSQAISIRGEHHEGEHIAQLSIDREPSTQLPVHNGEIEGESIGLESAPIFGEVLRLVHTKPDGSNIKAGMVFQAGEEGLPRMRIASLPLVRPEPTFRGSYLVAHRARELQDAAAKYTRLENAGEPRGLLETLQIVEPRLKRVRVGAVAGTPMLRGDVGIGRMVPLSLLGDGLGRLTSILLAVADAAGGVVLIDEIENGFHHSVLGQVWNAIGKAASNYETQVFATTHSFECIEAAHEAFRENQQYAFRLHRLERIAGEIHAITYDQGTLAAAIRSNLEVR